MRKFRLVHNCFPFAVLTNGLYALNREHSKGETETMDLNNPTEIDRLLAMVQMFANSDENKCWSTAKRWSVKEAKEALRNQVEKALVENAKRGRK